MILDMEHSRREYLRSGLSRDALLKDPVKQFKLWMNQAVAAQLPDPTAMTLATVSAAGEPSQRTVLLKQLDQRGFVFYTNFESQKSKDIAHNPHVSLHFCWLEFERQIKIQGIAKRLSTTQALKYFLSRPRDSQLAAWASQQSQVLGSRKILEQKFAEIKHKFSNGEIPLPSFWGGFIVSPVTFEFWQGRGKRLHDRFAYSPHTNNSNQWEIKRLAP